MMILSVLNYAVVNMFMLAYNTDNNYYIKDA